MAAAERTVPAPLAQLPNALTVARLVVIPIYAALILDARQRPQLGGRRSSSRLPAITDQIDGYLARRWHVESAFGKIADPLADRLLIDVAVMLLWHAGRLPWAALAIPARDVFLIAATPFALGRGYRFEVNILGKLATWLLYVSLALVMVVRRHDWPLLDLLDRLRARDRVALALRPPRGASSTLDADARREAGDRRGAGNQSCISQVEVDGSRPVRCNQSTARRKVQVGILPGSRLALR